MVRFLYFLVYIEDYEIEDIFLLMNIEILFLIKWWYYFGINIVDGMRYVWVKLLLNM